ncbi:hypothetical protein ACIBSV_02790 [Embleya sp. NPDC050154]|uniref:hypothetical protein n=1 Tax=unclassified Embleya TaxID=2699296 RepID=UPI0037BAA051
MNTHRPRGTCGVCGRRVAVTETHAVWRHDDPGHARADDAPISCRGSWTPAAEATDHTTGPTQLDLLSVAAAAEEGEHPDREAADKTGELLAGSAPTPAGGSPGR